jgi:hypothetical protein
MSMAEVGITVQVPPEMPVPEHAKYVAAQIRKSFGDNILIKSVELGPLGYQVGLEVVKGQIFKAKKAAFHIIGPGDDLGGGMKLADDAIIDTSLFEKPKLEYVDPIQKGLNQLVGKPLTENDFLEAASQIYGAAEDFLQTMPTELLLNKAEIEDLKIPPEMIQQGIDWMKLMANPSLSKGAVLEDEEGLLTPAGMKVAESYAKKWLLGVRDMELERQYPSLVGLFSDIRVDSELARMHATED